ncbi:unnamed protein product [Brassica oleracea var. botrytis]|uniref:Uncharacterized protein n=1 Tax=Brassica oleracea TaxID=3712 RepID=A0A3P6DGF3_BRAOL|nr:unnamed protein product [Brassica oleracea]
MPLENNAFQVAAPSEVDDEWIVRMHMWGFSKPKVPMSACSGRLQKAENQPFDLGRKLPEFRDCLRQSFLRHQHKTTPKTNKRKS